ncbi:50S ribosomal protein L25/general stress protein Ctc [Enterococcus sp.]|uniref:50S ribosomal protein L25/general stress protein Ctc n=1 Tax=Enterococcus sp. TaxID=35783 RepID=UPI002FC9080C
MSVSLEVSKRSTRPRATRNKLRHEGKIPGIINGYKIESTPISVDGHDFKRLLRTEGLNSVVKLTIDGENYNTLIHQFTTDTFTREINHVEFLSVDMSEVTEVEAELVLVGTAPGVRIGGALTQNLYNVIVSATPDKLPERIEVDISKLDIGQSITIADLPVSSDYEIITDPIEQIVAISEPRAKEEEVTEEEAPAAE